MRKIKIIFEKKQAEKLLSVFDMWFNSDGFVLRKVGKKRDHLNDIYQYDLFGKLVHRDNFAGIMQNDKGEPVPVRNNMHTLIAIADITKDI